MMQPILPAFTIHQEEEKIWFVILEGELTGVMFHIVEPSNDSDNGLMFDVSTNRFFEGNFEEQSEKIEELIHSFIDFAFADVAKAIEQKLYDEK